MEKKLKILIISSFAFSFLVSFAILISNRASIQAQQEPFSSLVCQDIIPIGEVFEETLSLMQDTYQELQNAHFYLSLVVEQLQSEVGELFRDPEKICDFSVCQPQVIDTAPTFELRISYLFGSTPIFGLHVPNCEPKECVGEPCPEIDNYLKNLKAFREGIKGAHEVVRDIFTTPSVPITKELQKEGETIGDLLRRPTAVLRKLKLARSWLKSGALIGGRKSCTLSKLEREKVALGELGERFPMRCVEAFEQRIYLPKEWAKKCQNECADFLSEECIKCLCQGDDGNQLPERKCLARLCGGSYFNYVCCQKEAIE